MTFIGLSCGMVRPKGLRNALNRVLVGQPLPGSEQVYGTSFLRRYKRFGDALLRPRVH